MNDNLDNFFDKCEVDDWSLLQQLNEQYEWLSGLTRLVRFEHSDVSGFTRNGDKICIELKDRGYDKPFTFDTVFIEKTKLDFLKERKEEGFKTAYINFMNNEAWVCDPLTDEWPWEWVWIYNKGKGCRERVKRWLIPRDHFKKFPFKIKVKPLYFR